jgi:hypothetical protein
MTADEILTRMPDPLSVSWSWCTDYIMARTILRAGRSKPKREDKVEKLVFIFRRKPGTTRHEYFDHYLEVHSQLGLRYKEGLLGYTVNLGESTVEFDAVTEIWIPSISEFLDPASNLGEGPRAIVEDHYSFMGPQDCYAIEEKILRHGSLESSLGAATPGTKIVSSHRPGEAMPEPRTCAYRVVDNVVTRVILRGDEYVDAAPGPSDPAVLRMNWASSAEAFGPLLTGELMLREFRFRVP